MPAVAIFPSQTPHRTLLRACRVAGVGLHSGAQVSAAIAPGTPAHGIRFSRADIAGAAPIPADPRNVTQTRLGTRLAADGVEVAVVEHLMAAFAACGVTCAEVRVEGPELPILDGSAAPFAEAMEAAGLTDLETKTQALHILEPIEIADEARLLRAEPADAPHLEIEIDFAEPAIGRQRASLSLDRGALRARLAPARTFCSLSDVEAMRSAGLALGGSMDNAIVVDGARILNPEGLVIAGEAAPDMFVLHKALDLVGDLYLLGMPVVGAITAVRPGHDLNTRFARRIAEVAGLAHRGAA